MAILKFIWLVLRPASKLEEAIGWVDAVNLLIVAAYPALATTTPLTDWFKNADLAWLFGIPVLLLLIAGIKLQLRLSRYENRQPRLQTRLIPFPVSGTRISKRESNDDFPLEEGYAKIAVCNTGGILEDCICTATGIALIQTRNGEILTTPLIFTNSTLFWDNGETQITIPNDGVDRYVNLAYIDQSNPGVWQLGIAEDKREDYFEGWYKVDAVISSLKTAMEPIEVEVAIGLGDTNRPASGLNLWPWDKWVSQRQSEIDKSNSLNQ